MKENPYCEFKHGKYCRKKCEVYIKHGSHDRKMALNTEPEIEKLTFEKWSGKRYNLNRLQ